MCFDIAMKRTVIAFLMLAPAALAQTKTTGTRPATRPRAATVSGRVFAITKSGDLKPARMASVYLLLFDAPRKGEDDDSLLLEWRREELWAAQAENEGVTADNAEWARGGWAVSADYMQQHWCLRTLKLTREALRRTLAWAEAHHKMSEVLMTRADEEGNFELAVPRPGVYDIFASGQAGFNDAFWHGVGGAANSVTVEAGSAYALKLASPETACLVTE